MNEQSPSLQDEVRRLHRAVDELSILNDLARNIGALSSPEAIIQTIVHRSVLALHAEQGVITLLDDHAPPTAHTLIRTMVGTATHHSFHVCQALAGWMLLHHQPLQVNDPHHDDRFRGVKWDEDTRSLLCVPLLVKSELKGILTLCNKRNSEGFSADDLRLLSIIASQSAQVIENARLIEEEKSLLQMRQELELARQIQADLLPKSPPAIPGYDVTGSTSPARVVGGDYYDMIQLEGERTAVCLGDVSGKGMAAALLMAHLQAACKANVLADRSAAGCVARVNTFLYASTGAEKFATLFLGILDGASHTITYCNAGHEHPFLLGRDGSMRRLGKGGIPVGMLAGFPFEEESVPDEPGDLLVIFSDGVSEAMNPTDELYSEHRLEAVLRSALPEDLSRISTAVLEDVRHFVAAAPQHDDMTLVMLKRHAG